MPGYVKSREATQFFREVLDIDPFDLAVKFEQWAVSKGESEFLPIRSIPSCS